MFYKWFEKSIILYGLLIYGRSPKTNLEKIDNVQRRILRAIFFRNKYDSMLEILSRNKINTISELFVQNSHDVFREVRLELPLKFLSFEE